MNKELEEVKQQELQKIEDKKGVIQDYSKMRTIAKDLYQSGLFTHLSNPQQALAIIEYGRELGVPPMKALTQMAVIRGKISTSSQLMLALAKKDGCNYRIKKHTKDVCKIKFQDPQGVKHDVRFTYKEAKDLALTDKDNWSKQRKNMLYWRVIAKAIRRHAPDTLLGIYTIEEMTEGGATTIEEYEDFEDGSESREEADYEEVETEEEQESERVKKVRKLVEAVYLPGEIKDDMEDRLESLSKKQLESLRWMLQQLAKLDPKIIGKLFKLDKKERRRLLEDDGFMEADIETQKDYLEEDKDE